MLKRLAPIRPSAGLELYYSKQLLKLADDMHRAVLVDLFPGLAQDASSVSIRRYAVKKMADKWMQRVNKSSEKLAKYLTDSITRRSRLVLKKSLGKIRPTKFKVSSRVQEVIEASIHENVSLIKSIPAHYFEQIEQLVMRSVMTGRTEPLVNDLEHLYGVTRKRAKLIASHQNGLVTSAIAHACMVEAGIYMAIWRHSGKPKEPRPTHLAAGHRQQKYDTTIGWFDPAVGHYIHPGELINCGCFSIPVVEGFD